MASDTTNCNIVADAPWHGVDKKPKLRTIWTILDEWGIDNPTEEDIWEAVAELDGHKLDYYEDGDLTEWL